MRYPKVLILGATLASLLVPVGAGAVSNQVTPVPPVDVSAPGAPVKLTSAAGKPLSIPVNGDETASEFVALNPDGTPKVYIPAGFPVDQIPDRLEDISAGSVPVPEGTVKAVFNHTDPLAHWSSYRYNGGVIDPNTRAAWFLDRSLNGEEDDVYSFTYDFNTSLRPYLTYFGVPMNFSPELAYFDDDGADGQCPEGGSGNANYSFVTICTSFNIQDSCNTDNPHVVGCAYVFGMNDGYHSGANHQPSVFNKAFLSTPYLDRNTVWHELGHTLGMGHNDAEWDSIMSVPEHDVYSRWTGHDVEDLSWKYQHAPD